MKKIISILMCAVLLFSLAACSGGTDKDTDTNATTESTTESTTEAAEEATISRGTIDGNVYTNDFAGFSFTKPDDWTFMTDEELTATINAGQSAMDLSSIEKTLAETASVYDMGVVDPYSSNNVMVAYENTLISGKRIVSESEYLEETKKTLETRATGITYESFDIEDVTLGDTTFKKMTCTATANGATIEQAIIVKGMGKYVVLITITSMNGEEFSTFEAMFS